MMLNSIFILLKILPILLSLFSLSGCVIAPDMNLKGHILTDSDGNRYLVTEELKADSAIKLEKLDDTR
jgi:hypothetical protein